MLFHFIFFLSFSFSAIAEQREALLYRPARFGSESIFNPISFYFNCAFDTVQNTDLFVQDSYLNKHKLVLKRTSSPISGVKNNGGAKKFFQDEFFGSRAAPNYTIHLLGGGYDFRKLAEWYDKHGYPYPYFFSFVTTYAARIGNEVVESADLKNIGPHDHIADLFFFDLLANLLFSQDEVVRFFRDKVQMLSWGSQPFYRLDNSHITNTSSQYIIRPQIKDYSVRPFLLFGMQVLAGASFPVENSSYFTVASGVAITDPLNNKGRLATGLFYDKEGSLMTSFFINSTENFRYRLNIYPGIIETKYFSTGVFVAYDRQDNFFTGLNLTMPIGIATTF